MMIRYYRLKKNYPLAAKHLWLFIILCCLNNIRPAVAASTDFRMTQSNPVKKIAKEIAKSNVYVYPDYTKTNGQDSKPEILYEELVKAAGADDLVELATKNKNAVVRLYAYRAIVRQFSKIPKDIFDQFSNDKSMVTTMRGTVKENTTVEKIAGSFLY